MTDKPPPPPRKPGKRASKPDTRPQRLTVGELRDRLEGISPTAKVWCYEGELEAITITAQRQPTIEIIVAR